MHEYALSYGKLGHYRVKQIEDRLGAWSFAAYTLADTPGSVPVGEATDPAARRRSPADRAADRRARQAGRVRGPPVR